MFKNFFSVLWQDKQGRINLSLSFSINIILWIAILIKTQGTTRPLPLHANAFYGIELVGSGLWLFALPAVGILILLMNTWLARRVAGFDFFLAQLLAYGTTVFHVLLAIAVLSIFLISA